MALYIRRVASINNKVISFYGPQEPKTQPDKSKGLIRVDDWCLVLKDGAHALEKEYFPAANGILEIK